MRCALVPVFLVGAIAFGRSIETRVRVGAWGGDHIRMTVTESGAHIEFDCASGDISEPLTVDGRGHLAVSGVFTPERGGPARKGDRRGTPARYEGTVDGDALTLGVTLTDSNERLGPFSAAFGAAGRLVKCR